MGDTVEVNIEVLNQNEAPITIGPATISPGAVADISHSKLFEEAALKVDIHP